jgi:putative transposase
MPQSFGSLHCHIVFSTKGRQPSIGPEIQPRLFEYIGGILRNQSSPLIAAGGMPDHVHLLASLSRTVSVAEIIRTVKANSSGWMRDELSFESFQWQNGYGAFNVSYSNLDQLKNYLAGQAEHHKQRDYQDEFRELLRRHNIEWDERYVWD